MTVGELKNLILEFPDDAVVILEAPDGGFDDVNFIQQIEVRDRLDELKEDERFIGRYDVSEETESAFTSAIKKAAHYQNTKHIPAVLVIRKEWAEE